MHASRVLKHVNLLEVNDNVFICLQYIDLLILIQLLINQFNQIVFDEKNQLNLVTLSFKQPFVLTDSSGKAPYFKMRVLTKEINRCH